MCFLPTTKENKMSTRYSTAEVRSIVKQIEVDAKMAGLIPFESELVYSPGNAANGISGTVMCRSTAEDSNHTYIRDADDFLPEFTYKMTRTDHARLLEATLRVFYSFRKQRDEADRVKRQQLSEHVARRSGT
jgi:hypothetical protein